MNTKSLATFAALGLLAASPALASPRVWKDASSGRTLTAEFVELTKDSVKVRRSSGKVVSLPLSRLTAEDIAFAKGAAKGGGALANDWPSWRGADRNGHSPDKGVLAKWPDGGPKLVWAFEDCGKGYSSPSVVGNRLYYTGSRKGKAEIICLDAGSGEEVWSTIIGIDPEKGYNTGWGAGTRGAPTVDDGLLYAMNANGDLVCVTADKGEKKWALSLVEDFGGGIPGWGYSESPLIDGNKLIVPPGGAQGAIVALDKKTGKAIWQSKDLKDGAQYSSVIVADVKGKRQYIQLFMKTLAGVDAETGDVLWTSKWPGRTAVIPTPIYSDGHVYISSGYGVGSKLVDITGGEAKDVWSNKVMKNHHGGVIKVGDHLYGFSDGPGLVCQDFKTGEQVWNERGEGKSKGAVHYVDGMLVCIDESEGSCFLAKASPDGFEELGRFPMPSKTKLRDGNGGKVWTHPVVVNGKLYLRDQDLVFCFDVQG